VSDFVVHQCDGVADTRLPKVDSKAL